MGTDIHAPLIQEAMMLLLQGKPQEAIARFDRAIAQNPGSAELLVRKAMLLGLIDRSEALATLEQALALDPKNAEAWSSMGANLVDANRLEEGIRACDRAIALDRRQGTAWYSKGTALLSGAVALKKGRQDATAEFDAALHCYENALYVNPEDPAAWFRKGSVLFNDLDQAGEALTCFVEAVRNNYGAPALKARDEAAHVLANELGDPRNLLERIRRLPRAEKWSRRAQGAFEAGRWDDALRLSDRAVGLAPRDAKAWHLKGRILERIGTDLGRPGCLAQAGACYRRALALDPGFTDARIDDARRLELDGWVSGGKKPADREAEPQLLEAVEAAEKNPAARPRDIAMPLTALCRHYFAQGQPEKAEPHYRKLRAITDTLDDMEKAALRAEMGIPGKTYILLQQNRGDDAERMLIGELEVMDRVLPAGHKDLQSHLYFAGNIYRMMGRHADALRLFERYVAAERERAVDDPARADGLTRLLDAQIEHGLTKEAENTAGEIGRLTGRRTVMDPALNEFERQLRSVWTMLHLDKPPDLIGAALNGDPGAGLVVGLCFAAGQGVPRNMDKALPWLEAAAKAGHPAAVKIVETLRGGADMTFDLQLIAGAARNWVDPSARPGIGSEEVPI